MPLSPRDRLDILELVARADIAATERDADAYVKLFTPDAVLDGAMGEHRGHELRENVGPIWQAEGSKTAHLALNTIVEPSVAGPDHATAKSMLLIVSLEPTNGIRTVVPIVQHVAKVDGHWLIERRTVGALAD